MPLLQSVAVIVAALHSYTPAPEEYRCDTRLLLAKERMAARYRDTEKVDTYKGKDEDFSKKDALVAAELGMTVEEYAVLGARPTLILASDAMLSAMEEDDIYAGPSTIFRDDKRQALITRGTRSRVGYSYHGGSKITRGFGDGQAIDIKTRLHGLSATERDMVNRHIWAWIDKRGREFNLCRVYLHFDSPHVGLCDGTEYRTRHPGIVARIAAAAKRLARKAKARLASLHGHKRHAKRTHRGHKKPHYAAAQALVPSMRANYE